MAGREHATERLKWLNILYSIVNTKPMPLGGEGTKECHTISSSEEKLEQFVGRKSNLSSPRNFY